MFRGVFSVNLDAKGRMALPTRLRGGLHVHCEGRLVLTVHQDGCLLLYPLPEWEDVERKVMRLPNQDHHTRQLQRMLLGHATDLEMDGHGRILIPPMLREFAVLEKKVVLAGLANKLEIWNEESWAKRRDAWSETEDAAGDMSDALRNLTL